MTSTQGNDLASQIIRNDPSKAEPLLRLLYAFREAKGDPISEAMTQDVLKYLYTFTDDCDEAMLRFISHPLEARLVA